MGYNWRSAHYFASRGDLGIQKFTTMPILILHGDNNSGNPTPLAQPAEIAADIGTTNIYVGPYADAPSTVACISSTVGAPNPVLTNCPTSFAKSFDNPCVSNVPPSQCPSVWEALSLSPKTGHYLVVFHNMDHTNGGFAIMNTFSDFVTTNFGTQPGCDGLTSCNN